MNTLAKPNPRSFGALFNSELVNPKDKTERGKGFTSKQLCKYGSICTAGCNQLLKCYKDVDMWLLPEHFSILCGSCQNAVENEKNVFESAHMCLNSICIGDPKAFVYFISDGEYIKIGKAVDPYRRLAEIQTGNPRRCSVVSMIPCYSSSAAHELERFLHNCYRSKSTVGEWFDIEDDTDVRRFQIIYPPRKEESDAADLS